ncbi:transcriptional regulator ATRX-like isoform X2 [Anopheles albimanus]|nr:transcriptional regulator ATRX-like isoform X2 [Anopheles albimanus]
MEVGDFNHEEGENLIAVELLSDDDDERSSLSTIPLSEPSPTARTLRSRTNSVLSGDDPHELGDKNNTLRLHNHGFLSDHEYLHIVGSENSSEKLSLDVHRDSERFSISYDMDIRTQDLFDKDDINKGNSGNQDHNDRHCEEERAEDKPPSDAVDSNDDVMAICDLTEDDYAFARNETVPADSDELSETDEAECVVQSLLENVSTPSKKSDSSTSSIPNDDHAYATSFDNSPECSPMQGRIRATTLDDLLSLGEQFQHVFAQFLNLNGGDPHSSVREPDKINRFTRMIRNVSSQIQKVKSLDVADTLSATQPAKRLTESGMQTVESSWSVKAASEREDARDRRLNEKCKRKYLGTANGSETSSSSSDSDSENSDSSSTESEDINQIMNDFGSRRRLLNGSKSTAEKKAPGQDGLSGRVNDHIYSSSDEELDSTANEERADGEDGLLDGVFSGVDDIMLDVHDILPAAEGGFQDFLEKEEARKNQEQKTDTDSQLQSKADSTEANGATTETRPARKNKKLTEMTESELEEYYEEQQDKEIERLCNISNLNIPRNTSSTATVTANASAAKATSVQQKKEKKKAGNTMEEFLNDNDENHALIPAGDVDDANVESRESPKKNMTEEEFLRDHNESMKHQLLNQLSSSSDTGSESDTELDEEDSGDTDKQNGDSEGDSADSVVLDQFLKSLNRHEDRVSKRKRLKTNSQSQSNENEAATDGSTQAGAGVDADKSGSLVENEPTSDATLSQTIPESALPKSKPDKFADPKDKALFSNELFEDVDDLLREETGQQGDEPQKKRTRKVATEYVPRRRKPREQQTSDQESDRGDDDSDVELLDEAQARANSRRKGEPPRDDPFDFSDMLAGQASKAAANVRANESPSSVLSTSDPKPVVTTPASSLSTENASKRKSSKDDDCISLSSDSDDESQLVPESAKVSPDSSRRKIRAMLSNDELAEETKKAQKEEEDRLARLKKKNEMLKHFLKTYEPGLEESDLVLDYDAKQKKAICVHPDIVALLKPHQIEGIRFMYDNTYGAVDSVAENAGSGCILAHCMGLGKTLQIIALLHTVMRYPQLRTRRILVICPKSTVLNWKEEIHRWQDKVKDGTRLKVFCFPDVSPQITKVNVLRDWHSLPHTRCGVMLIGYEAFRALINNERRKRPVGSSLKKVEYIQKQVKELLINPGADLVICDEGHQIKNKRSAISEAVSKIKTRRRIVLTGTPIQNNLKEYYCMVNFIKPSFLGSDKEFSNLYANPIKNGQHKDSDQRAIKIMKQRSYVLHNKLCKFVQRKEAAVLKDFLPEKYEYVLFVPLTPVQERMYEVFLQMNEYTSNNEHPGEPAKAKKFKLIADYTSLRKIWTHPKVLEKAWESAIQEKNRKDAARKTASLDTDEESPDDRNDIKTGTLSVMNDWWREYLGEADLESLVPSNKLWIMFEILKQCNDRGEKCLIFSAFVAVLNVVEHFMAKINDQTHDLPHADAFGYSAFKGPWEAGKDYYRLDGKTNKSIRHDLIRSFNDPRNTRVKCFLISAKAGGQGINLTAANRVIILDTSWNPSNDQQNIFRIFRLGQKRKCYVYRLLAMGTMEEKVYSRSVTKQALSFRVVDEQQVDRHYRYDELAELYNLTKVADMTRETPIRPADDLLASLLHNFPNKIFKYHEHDSLLENKPEQDLSEEEKKEAWAAYEREIQNNEKPAYPSQFGMMPGSGMYGFGLSSLYPNMGLPGMPMGGGDMYRSDFSYNSALNRPLYPFSQQFSMLNDPTYASLLSKFYGSYTMPGSGGMLDFGMPPHAALTNGQPMPPSIGGTAGASKSYDATSALSQFYNMYNASSSSSLGLPPPIGSSLGGSNGLPPPSSTSTLASLAAQYGSPSGTSGSPGSSASSQVLNALRQITDYQTAAQQQQTASSPITSLSSSSGLKISEVTSLANQFRKSVGPSTSRPGSTGSATATLLNMLNDHTGHLSALNSVGSGVSSPFSPRSAPLLPPTLDHPVRNYPSTPLPPPASPVNTAAGQPTIAAAHEEQGTARAASASGKADSAVTVSNAGNLGAGGGGNAKGTTTSNGPTNNGVPVISSVVSMAQQKQQQEKSQNRKDSSDRSPLNFNEAKKKPTGKSLTTKSSDSLTIPTHLRNDSQVTTVIPIDDEEPADRSVPPQAGGNKNTDPIRPMVRGKTLANLQQPEKLLNKMANLPKPATTTPTPIPYGTGTSAIGGGKSIVFPSPPTPSPPMVASAIRSSSSGNLKYPPAVPNTAARSSPKLIPPVSKATTPPISMPSVSRVTTTPVLTATSKPVTVTMPLTTTPSSTPSQTNRPPVGQQQKSIPNAVRAKPSAQILTTQPNAKTIPSPAPTMKPTAMPPLLGFKAIGQGTVQTPAQKQTPAATSSLTGTTTQILSATRKPATIITSTSNASKSAPIVNVPLGATQQTKQPLLKPQPSAKPPSNPVALMNTKAPPKPLLVNPTSRASPTMVIKQSPVQSSTSNVIKSASEPRPMPQTVTISSQQTAGVMGSSSAMKKVVTQSNSPASIIASAKNTNVGMRQNVGGTVTQKIVNVSSASGLVLKGPAKTLTAPASRPGVTTVVPKPTSTLLRQAQTGSPKTVPTLTNRASPIPSIVQRQAVNTAIKPSVAMTIGGGGTARGALGTASTPTVVTSSIKSKPIAQQSLGSSNVVSVVASAVPATVSTTSTTPAATGRTVSYSFTDASKEYTITKATAAPTIRQIQSNSRPHILFKRTGNTVATSGGSISTLSTTTSSPTIVGPVKSSPSLVPPQSANESTIVNTASAMPMRNLQPGAVSTNNVIIRKRKSDVALLDNLKARNSSLSISEIRSSDAAGGGSVQLAKRTKLNESAAAAAATILGGHRLGANIMVTQKTIPTKTALGNVSYDVVELE